MRYEKQLAIQNPRGKLAYPQELQMPSPGRKGCVNTFSGRLGCPLGILNVIVNAAPIMGRTAEVHVEEAQSLRVREGFLLPALSAQLTIRLSALSFPDPPKDLVSWIIVLMIHPAIQLHTRILPLSQLSFLVFYLNFPYYPSGLSQLHNLSTKPNSQILFMMGDFIQSKLLFL